MKVNAKFKGKETFEYKCRILQTHTHSKATLQLVFTKKTFFTFTSSKNKYQPSSVFRVMRSKH